MPVVYYSLYDPEGLPLPEVTEHEHNLGLSLLGKGLSDLYGLPDDADNVNRLIARTVTGKPYLPEYPDIFFNITHTNGLAACAFSDHPVGIDAEWPGYFAEVLVGKALADSEKLFLQSHGVTDALRKEWFYRFWTLKEAYVKFTGTGVDTDLRSFSFVFEEEKTGPCEVSYSIICSDPGVSCFQCMLPSGHILSLCSDHPSGSVILNEISLP